MRNPHEYVLPITNPTEFFGREREAQQAFESLNIGQHCHVIGIAKIGKTSFRYQLANPKAFEKERRALKGKCLYLTFDFIRDVGAKTPPEQVGAQFWGKMRSEIAEALQENLLNDGELSRALLGQVNELKEPIDYGKIQNITSILSRKGIRIVCLLDEFQKAMGWDSASLDGFCADLKSWAQSDSRVVYVILTDLPFATEPIEGNEYEQTLGRELQALMPELAFRAIRLGPVDDTTASKIIGQSGLLGEDEPFITQSAGGHPYMVQILCHKLYEYREREKEVAETTILEHVQRDKAIEWHYRKHFTYQLGGADKKAVEVLIEKRPGADPVADEKVLQALTRRMPEDRARMAIARITGMGTVTKRDNKLRLVIASFKEWVQKAADWIGVPPKGLAWVIAGLMLGGVSLALGAYRLKDVSWSYPLAVGAGACLILALYMFPQIKARIGKFEFALGGTVLLLLASLAALLFFSSLFYFVVLGVLGCLCFVWMQV